MESRPPVCDAGVLVPVYRRGGDDIRLVLVRRAEGGVHGGQLAFPGGKREAGDASLAETAIREAREEVGIDTASIEVVEHLPVVETNTTGFRIWPFLARVVPPPVWRRQEREIAEIVEVSLRDLARPEAHGEGVEGVSTASSRPHRTRFYRVGAHRLWGATYRILHPLIPRLLADEWTV